MVRISAPWPTLSPDLLDLYYTADPLLSHTPTLIFYGPSSTTNSTLNSSRIQAHIFTPAGFQSYPRITVSPNSHLYAAVKCLPRHQQGDEICRGLAVALFKYFSDIPDGVKDSLIKEVASSHLKGNSRASGIFGELHVGDVVSRMVQVHNVVDVTRDIQAALEVRSISNVDLDVILPTGTIQSLDRLENNEEGFEDWESYARLQRYGDYAPLIKLFGEPTFIPTSTIRRAPSRPTTLNRSKSLLKKQKDSVRREMCELVDTEERYVDRLKILVTEIAEDFRLNLRARTAGSSDSHDDLLKKLFPTSLNNILDVNTRFFSTIRSALSAPELEMADCPDVELESIPSESKAGPRFRGRDTTGSLALSKAMLDWFPQFESCYADYMRASSEHSSILTKLLRDGNSSFAQRIRETGEQRLRSMLIEPVQRLPRYSLFIDNIANQLPLTHPALQPLFKCRDIITNICCLESSSVSQNSLILNRLRNLTAAWPNSLRPQGRLISAADVTELGPPYRLDQASEGFGNGILLLFADCLVLVQKRPDCSLTARGVVAEVDRPSMETMAASFEATSRGQPGPPRLSFGSCFSLHDVQIHESNDDKVFWMASASAVQQVVEHPPDRLELRAFFLHGSYSGKSSRWTGEVAKARIECRFSEQERESNNWELRTLHDPESSLTLLTTISEREPEMPGNICLVVDDARRFADLKVDDGAVHVAISVSTLEDQTYSLELRGLNAFASIDTTRAGDFVSVLCSRLGQCLYQQGKPFTPAFILSKVLANKKTLQSIKLSLESEPEQPKSRGFRPPSPVKFFSNFIGGTLPREPSSPRKQRNAFMENVPEMRPPSRKRTGSGDHKTAVEETAASKVTLISTSNKLAVSNSMQRLEDTFGTYIQALHGRRGNIVARVLRGRSCADELATNEVYNCLLNNSHQIHTAMEASVDVLFAAFEKFLRVAWKDQMGPIISVHTLSLIRDKSDTLLPGDFQEYFKANLAELAPQNRRSLSAMVKILADLLDGASNDGDKGALTATFAELLVTEGNPHEYISLLDRVVEDCDRLFDGQPFSGSNGDGASTNSSVNSSTRARSVNTGSLSSNTSSLRKKFGFSTLTRENSKLESESRVGSVWRTLSKTARNATTGEHTFGSVSKTSLVRSKSTDIDGRMLPPQTPNSNRPTVLGSFTFESSSRPGSSSAHSAWGSVSGSPNLVNQQSPSHPRKKRRSSLSDLKTLQDSPMATSICSITPRRKDFAPRAPSPPSTPSPVKDFNGPSTTKPSPRRKEYSPSSRGTLTERPSNIQTEEVTISEHRSPRKTPSQTFSSIPTLRSGNTQRPKSSHAPDSPSRKGSNSPQKLRLQSPQKLRERLQNEQIAIQGVESGLQLELAKIGEAISKVGRSNSHAKLPATSTSTSPTKSSSTSAPRSRTATTSGLLPNNTAFQAVSARLAHLENTFPAQVAEVLSRTTSLQTDMSATLLAAETKARKLDELCREANAENEALYERFNIELEKVVGSTRRRGKEETETETEVMAQVKSMGQEVAKWRNEVGRLKRENVGLVARVKGLEEGRKEREE
ncbi:MAG: hypothetical protein M1837_007405 [Sclerophora amabilis]|nr:MAG: hypothetical protein M1837_007405 [Sclerophora amabilis]